MRKESRPPAGGISKRQLKGKQSSTKLPVSKAQPDKSKMATSKKTDPSTADSRTVSPDTSETSQSHSQPAPTAPPASPGPVKAGTKRKEREFEHDTGRETNIRVIVRCRGRNEREIKENSGVVVSTSGIKGDSLEVSMGPNALGNKTYHFDRVFSPAADQAMIYDEVVTPMLEEIIAGYNCTIFAYGQTGTGKTYTMSGDMSDTMGLVSDAAGIIPRVLHALFGKLEAEERESTVKCSFIELYNEELRDLLAVEETAKLKIYDDGSRRTHGATHVQGAEEAYVKRAAEGIELLKAGNHRRQVAATKCNDLSSRSHTVFTVTVYVKRTAENGEDFVSAGKLNLVDLAGSENIQRSGAENKRAAEAGLINKSLLTLGRVINALVEKSSHIPYRESKLTRLLQDSLGGRTKTCIVATVSPAKSNLDETISTLDYAFRAKNIRNKPQVNQLVSKKTLLRDFTAEIEKLKSELVAARQRNGVYLSTNSYEQLMGENESRRILTEEQQTKIELIENNLRSKLQELFSVTGDLNLTRKENESLRASLEQSSSLLEKTEIMLARTKQSLTEETALREAHQSTEVELTQTGGALLARLDETVNDVNSLQEKLEREKQVHGQNSRIFGETKTQTVEVTEAVRRKLNEIERGQRRSLVEMSERIRLQMDSELSHHGERMTEIFTKEGRIVDYHKSLTQLATEKRTDAEILHEVMNDKSKAIRDSTDMAAHSLSVATERISAEVADELAKFDNQLQNSYSTLRQDLQSVFHNFTNHLEEQKAERDELQRQLREATTTIAELQRASSEGMDVAIVEEQTQADIDRQNLLSQISNLVNTVNASADARKARLTSKNASIKQDINGATVAMEAVYRTCDEKIRASSARLSSYAATLVTASEVMDQKLQGLQTEASEQGSRIQANMKQIHEDGLKTVEARLEETQSGLDSLDSLMESAETHNQCQFEEQETLRQEMLEFVGDTLQGVQSQYTGAVDRLRSSNAGMEPCHSALRREISKVVEEVHPQLHALRTEVSGRELEENNSTGQTPPRKVYDYSRNLPKTNAPEEVLAAFRRNESPTEPMWGGSSPVKNPSTMVLRDATVSVNIGESEDPKPSSPPRKRTKHRLSAGDRTNSSSFVPRRTNRRH